MHLSDEQKRMLAGEHGRGSQKALAMLVKYGEAFGAERLVRVDTCHAGIGPQPFLEEMLDEVDHIQALTTLHAGGAGASTQAIALGLRQSYILREQASQKASISLCVSKGFIPTMSCAPYLAGNVVKPGAVFSWPGSSGALISNSLFGGRGNRDAFPASLASSITGFTPDMLLLRKENRRAEVLVTLKGDLDPAGFSEADYGAMGYHIGAIGGLKNVAIAGLPNGLPFEKLKALLSPMPVSGATTLCHIVGTTPEAHTVEEALGNRRPEVTIDFGNTELERSRQSLHTAKTTDVEVVFFGCPHLTVSEIGQIAGQLASKKKAEHVRLWISTSMTVQALAERMGYIDIIEKAGGVVVTDTCIMGFPYDQLEDGVKTAATNSARAASYQARRGIGIQYGTYQQCVNAAISGKWEG
jgi:cis-L-3-hydroxyproline dehydratase